jgi:hypothetical protein
VRAGPGRSRGASGGWSLLWRSSPRWSFGATRAVYGVFAAVHAWVEIPVLLAAIALQPVRVEVG